MRELLYVSERSLAPLHEDRPPRWWRRLARSAAAPRWWADRGLEPGQLVHFEHRLSHVVLDFPGPATVFFLSTPAVAGSGPSGAASAAPLRFVSVFAMPLSNRTRPLGRSCP